VSLYLPGISSSPRCSSRHSLAFTFPPESPSFDSHPMKLLVTEVSRDTLGLLLVCSPAFLQPSFLHFSFLHDAPTDTHIEFFLFFALLTIPSPQPRPPPRPPLSGIPMAFTANCCSPLPPVGRRAQITYTSRTWNSS